MMTVFHRDIKTPRRELKIRRAAEYFDGISRCFNSEWNAVSNIWYIFLKKTKQRSTRSVTTKNTQFNRKSAVFGLQMGTFRISPFPPAGQRGVPYSGHVGWLYLWSSHGGLFKVSYQRAGIIMKKCIKWQTFILTYDSQSACNFWSPHEVLHSPSHRFSERGLSSFAL